MPNQSNWEHMNVALPLIKYDFLSNATQAPSSTTWAAHSRTPKSVQLWTDFEDKVDAEGEKEENQNLQDLDLRQILLILEELILATVRAEVEVTSHLYTILNACSPVFGKNRKFDMEPKYFKANPDIIATEIERNDVGTASAFEFPQDGQKKRRRDEVANRRKESAQCPFEVKPYWKFSSLDTRHILENWEVPEKIDGKSLPSNWSGEKKKVFHLVRQVYGQMTSDNLRYGIVTTYEKWFFCKRSEDGVLSISRVFDKLETSPSVLMAIKTMLGFNDYRLIGSEMHPKSPSNPKIKKGSKSMPRNALPKFMQGFKPADKKGGKGGKGGNGKSSNSTHFALSLEQWDWEVYFYTDNVQLLTTKKDSSIIAKMQLDPKMQWVADEMANEVKILEVLKEKEKVRDVIPCFYFHHRCWGVSLSCFGKELDNLEDIGLANLSNEIKHSAVHAVEVLSDAGVLHNDIELRNFVQSRDNPEVAKIIDFGRATFSKDRKKLLKQIDDVKALLKIEESSLSSNRQKQK